MDPTKDFIEEHIPQMNSPEKVYELFKGLGFKTMDSRCGGKENWDLWEKDKEFVEKIYTITDYKDYNEKFRIFLVELKSHSSTTIRNLPIYFEKEFQYPFFVFTSDYKNYIFVLVQKIREDIGVWKRKLIKLNLNREFAYYTDKWILSEIGNIDKSQDPGEIYNALIDAFSVEKVTKKFFDDYRKTFSVIRDSLFKQTRDEKWAHDYSLQLLNRIMFLYFVQKKRWLDNNPRFITDFWQAYKKAKTEKDSFYEKWLSVLFFEAFNNKFFPKPYFSKDLNSALALAPFLNGGLFTPNKLDKQTFKITDDLFEEIFAFFDKYNFTIREELPLEVEVAVDPEMIGKVYESLVNISEKADERGEAGIFYTARTEIDFMCRMSLAEFFNNHLDVDKAIIYEFIFAKTDEDKKKVDKQISQHRLWEKIELLLDELTVIDPACGSGSFLVGMLSILSDLYKRTYVHLNRQMSDFDIKKSIIGRSLYGVDVMDWAVHVAELRLWLQLIVETELKLEQLKIQPLLPNLSFKIRQGDSLVQEIGGVNLAVRTGTSDISSYLKRKLTELKTEKLKFFNNDPSRKFRSEAMLLQEELNIFREILEERALYLSKRIKELRGSMQRPLKFPGEVEKPKDDKESIRKEIQKLEEELENIKEARTTLKGVRDKPFVWDIDFAEIFSGEKKGFDIVIGNPPYVRQEKIAPPLVPKEKVTNEMKRLYKDKLEDSIKAHFEGRLPKKLDKKSDLYIYFYFHGLALLNPNGTLCFITSNSWLDVGYGKDLQQFLLENVHVKAIYDNCAKRSFTQADINTIIVILSAPFPIKSVYQTKIGQRQKPAIDKDRFSKFVLFKEPFEYVINTKNLIEIENVRDTLNTNSCRVRSISQKRLLEEGCKYLEDTTEEYKKIFKSGVVKYTGNKWGKYLRAPEIYFKILEKGKDKLVKLGDIVEVRFGIKTGANEFFYLKPVGKTVKEVVEIAEKDLDALIEVENGAGWHGEIEAEFLKPVIKSPRELKTIMVRIEDLNYLVLMCHKDRKELKDKKVLEYIEWGEKQKTKGWQGKQPAGVKFKEIKSFRGRKFWYSIEAKTPAPLIMWKIAGERFAIFYNKNLYYSDQTFYLISPKDKQTIELLLIFMNSTVGRLTFELGGIEQTGAYTILEITVEDSQKLLCLHPTCLKKQKLYFNFETSSIFTELGFDPKKPIRLQEPNPLPDRKALDDIVFDALSLTEEERKEVYWSVCELVKNRLEKARSV